MKDLFFRIVALGIIGWALLLSTTGCRNTAHGAGKDIEKIGEKIQEKTD